MSGGRWRVSPAQVSPFFRSSQRTRGSRLYKRSGCGRSHFFSCQCGLQVRVLDVLDSRVRGNERVTGSRSETTPYDAFLTPLRASESVADDQPNGRHGLP